jgi:hypothetical protein
MEVPEITSNKELWLFTCALFTFVLAALHFIGQRYSYSNGHKNLNNARMKKKEIPKGHIKDMTNEKDNNTSIEQAGNAKNLVVIKLFEKDNFLLFVYKKVERIVSALYLLGDLLSDNEPIKWKLREVGIAIISRIMSFTTNPMLKSEIVSSITSDLLKILSFIEVAFFANLISEMNFTILKKELEALLETLNFQSVSKQEIKDKSVTFGKEFFAIPDDLFIQNNKFGRTDNAAFSEPENNSQRRQPVYSWSNIEELDGVISKEGVKGQDNIKDKKFFTDSHELGRTQKHKGQISENTSGNERQKTIIKLLNGKNNLTIKDFLPVIKGCSEKTIQRELLRLVKIGVLKKEGERRWSRYSLAVKN